MADLRAFSSSGPPDSSSPFASDDAPPVPSSPFAAEIPRDTTPQPSKASNVVLQVIGVLGLIGLAIIALPVVVCGVMLLGSPSGIIIYGVALAAIYFAGRGLLRVMRS